MGSSMATNVLSAAGDLPESVALVLTEFVQAVGGTLGEALQSVVLFGSAAENRLRSTSDVNVVVVVSLFDPSRVAAVRPALQKARAAVRLNVMWIQQSEIAQAADAFAVKFADIGRRHRVLFGSDPFSHVVVSRDAAVKRLRQVLLNQVLRLRASFALDGDREERLAKLVADAAGPLRASAAELLALEGAGDLAPREALARAAAEWKKADAQALLGAISTARDTRRIEPGQAASVLLDVIDLAEYLYRRVSALASARA